MHSRGALYAYIGAAEVVVDVDAQRHTSTMVVDSILIRMCSSIAFGHVAHISAIFRAPTTTKAAFIPFDCDEIQSEEEKILSLLTHNRVNSWFFWFILIVCLSSTQELLHRTEQEDQQRKLYFNNQLPPRPTLDSNHHPGGSLQDLVEAVNDSDFLISGQNKRHQLNSRHKKNNSSSVSSRQREGGSLPSNVNVSTTCREHFLHEINKSLSYKGGPHNKTERLSGGPHVGLGSRQNSVGSGCRDDIGTDAKKTHTVIEIDDYECDDDERKHLLAHDSLAQVRYFIIDISIYTDFSLLQCSA